MPHDPADWLTTFENFVIVWRALPADVCTFENERHMANLWDYLLASQDAARAFGSGNLTNASH
jgi:hypothetical protein